MVFLSDEDKEDNNEETDSAVLDLDNFYRQGTIAADLAPVLHYGATVIVP